MMVSQRSSESSALRQMIDCASKPQPTLSSSTTSVKEPQYPHQGRPFKSPLWLIIASAGHTCSCHSDRIVFLPGNDSLRRLLRKRPLPRPVVPKEMTFFILRFSTHDLRNVMSLDSFRSSVKCCFYVFRDLIIPVITSFRHKPS